ncbi:NUDIX hydrolase [Mesoplasma melaleucae]|uniref:Nucleoside diphosphate hydrolase n=1 Tax=Mesoplasma melaleucae TaxID=81459 RepID=A0A2K8NXA6_9MOLU|nr:NUDIX domain-containing protein [Mesoplasma melaleucae]ATZ18176.1 nucleoside diphosphate hydrolase [Mesoplasma melaleucae]
MEVLDLYDMNGIKTDKTMIRGTKVPEGCYKRKIVIGIFNSNNEMLIQKVAKERTYWTNKWTPSVSGSVWTGETSQQTAAREAKEELGINIDFSKIRPAFTINFYEDFNDIYLIKKDLNLNDLVLQKEEVAEVKWASKAEIIKMTNTNEFIPLHESIIEMMFTFKDTDSSYKGN